MEYCFKGFYNAPFWCKDYSSEMGNKFRPTLLKISSFPKLLLKPYSTTRDDPFGFR